MKKRQKGLYIILALLVLALVLAFVTPLLSKKMTASGTFGQNASPPKGVTAKGIVESRLEVDISSRIDGTIKNMYAEEGRNITQGAPLVVFDDDKVMAKVRQAEGEYSRNLEKLRELESGNRTEDIASARAAVERAEVIAAKASDDAERYARMHEKGAVTRAELLQYNERLKVARSDLNAAQAGFNKAKNGFRPEEIRQARSALRSSEADVQYARAKAGDYTLKSPISGIVAERHGETGESVKEGTLLYKLIDPAALRVRTELEESDLGKIKEGQRAEVTCEAYPGKVYRGIVEKVMPVVRRKTQKTFDPTASLDINTQEIRVALDTQEGLKNGQSVTVRFLP